MLKTQTNDQRILEARAQMALNAMDALHILYPARMTPKEAIALYKSFLAVTA